MTSDPVLFQLPERAGLPEAGQLATDLVAALASDRSVQVDTSATSEVGLAVVQVLVSAHGQAAAQGVRLEVTLPEGGALERCLASHAMDGATGGLRIEAGLWTGLDLQEAPR